MWKGLLWRLCGLHKRIEQWARRENLMKRIACVGSKVSRDVPPYVVAVGNPCRPISKIFTDEVLMCHLRELGLDNEQAFAVVVSRSDALRRMGMTEISVIDQTERYGAIWR